VTWRERTLGPVVANCQHRRDLSTHDVQYRLPHREIKRGTCESPMSSLCFGPVGLPVHLSVGIHSCFITTIGPRPGHLRASCQEVTENARKACVAWALGMNAPPQ
jgi:hypothetical protein